MKSKVLIVVATSLVLALALLVVAFKQGQLSTTGVLRINVVTTTSLYQTGLLNTLLEDFRSRLKEQLGIDVYFYIIAKGSGEALRLLADGSACIGFTHSPPLEYQYMSQGKVDRLMVFAYNEFVVVGPPSDPAGVSRARDAVEAFKKIYEAGERGLAEFVSRGDMSGTHVREVQLWRLAGVNPEGKRWYLRSGQGMTQTLLMAENFGAYTLTDTGTYLSLVNQGKLGELSVLLEDKNHLLNVYSMYVSTSPQCSGNSEVYYVALKLKTYLSREGQELIEEKYSGLFEPIKGKEEMLLSIWESLSKLG